MTLKEEITALEVALKGAGASLDATLAAAEVDRSTWTRWKNGSVKGARYDTVVRVREAVGLALAGKLPVQHVAPSNDQPDATA